MLNIIEGTLSPPLKAVIYGPEGIGKSTLVSNAPNPLYIDTEDGASRMNVRRVRPKSWDEHIAIIEEVAKTPGLCETLIIDTADWAEMMCIQDICTKYKVSGLESFGYGKGYTYVGEEMTRMLAACDKVVGSRGYAHFKPRTYMKDGEERQANDVDKFYDHDEKNFPAESEWMEISGQRCGCRLRRTRKQ